MNKQTTRKNNSETDMFHYNKRIITLFIIIKKSKLKD